MPRNDLDLSALVHPPAPDWVPHEPVSLPVFADTFRRWLDQHLQERGPQPECPL
jgi:hypothetical protein